MVGLALFSLEGFLLVAVIGALTLFLLKRWNRTAFRKTNDTASAQVSKVANWFWSRDPLANKNDAINRYAEEVENATGAVAEYNAALTKGERLIAASEEDKHRLNAIAEQYTLENNDAMALEKLQELEEVERGLATLQKNQKTNQEGFNSNMARIQTAMKTITKMRQDAKRQGRELKMSRANQALAKLAPALNKVGKGFDQFDEIDEEIQSQIDLGNAQGEVLTELQQGNSNDEGVEKRAAGRVASAKLAEMKARLQGTSTSETVR